MLASAPSLRETQVDSAQRNFCRTYNSSFSKEPITYFLWSKKFVCLYLTLLCQKTKGTVFISTQVTFEVISIHELCLWAWCWNRQNCCLTFYSSLQLLWWRKLSELGEHWENQKCEGLKLLSLIVVTVFVY